VRKVARKRCGLVGIVVCAVAFAASPAASAHEAGTLTEAQEQRVLGDSTRLAGGLYAVRAGDTVLTTHGPDPITAAAHGRGAARWVGDPERAPVCTTNVNDYSQHVLYAYNQGAENKLSTVRPHIQSAIRRMNYVLDRDSVASGGPHADYRVLCDGAGAIVVQAFPVPPPASGQQSSFANIVSAAQAAGYTRGNVDYSIFYDASGGACGVGSLWFDDGLSAGNYNNNPGGGVAGGYAVTYGPYTSPTIAGCWYGHTPMHENGHNQGATQQSAPYSTGTGAHCWDEIDVMCYSPDGGNQHQEGTVVFCSDREYFDCRYDTYFDTAPEPGEWLATHWNLGSTLNRFIVHGAEANEAPRPRLRANCNGLTCAVRDLSTDADGAIASREWDFGDGTTSSAELTSKTYAADGGFEMTLTVTDDDGAEAQIVRNLAVAASGVPVLANGRLTADAARAQGAPMKMFRLPVPAGRTQLTVDLVGPATGDLDLYVRQGSAPTAATYDCRPFEGDSRESCAIANPAAADWYVGIDNAGAANAAAFTIRARASR
jgi:hypothetical protein